MNTCGCSCGLDLSKISDPEERKRIETLMERDVARRKEVEAWTDLELSNAVAEHIRRECSGAPDDLKYALVDHENVKAGHSLPSKQRSALESLALSFKLNLKGE